MNHIRRFTEEEDVKIVLMRARGMTTKAIAMQLNRNPSSVHQRIVHLGCANTKPRNAVDYKEYLGPDGGAKVRKADQRFIRALAKAFMRGDHLPAAQRLAA